MFEWCRILGHLILKLNFHFFRQVESDRQLENMISTQGQAQSELVGRLQKDEELQRAAVGALLERSDARSWGLVQQVALVESQLAALTAVEMERRKLEMDEQVVCR